MLTCTFASDSQVWVAHAMHGGDFWALFRRIQASMLGLATKLCYAEICRKI